MRIASWNILAPAYCVVDRYPHCPPGWDAPQARAELIVQKVRALCTEADAVCLQEVDEDLASAIVDACPSATSLVAPHPHRRDATMVLTTRPCTARKVLAAGRMRAASVDLDLDGAIVRVAATHLEWSEDGRTGAGQLDDLLAALDEGNADHRLIGMDANGSWSSPVCGPLRQAGWVATPEVPTARIGDRGWLALDTIAADSGQVQLLEVLGESAVVPSLTWPSDHLAITASFTPGA